MWPAFNSTALPGVRFRLRGVSPVRLRITSGDSVMAEFVLAYQFLMAFGAVAIAIKG
jgi:hypothetical protein